MKAAPWAEVRSVAEYPGTIDAADLHVSPDNSPRSIAPHALPARSSNRMWQFTIGCVLASRCADHANRRADEATH